MQRDPETATHVMSLGEHLEELRKRIIQCLVLLAAAFVLCWVLRDDLLEILTRPHARAMAAFGLKPSLHYASYFESLVAQLKACVIVALVVTGPFHIYQTWAFVAPGLFHHERHKVLKLGLACAACFAASVCFGYFLFVPVALRYLLSLSGPDTVPVLMISHYLSTFFTLTFALGLAFQTPVVVFCLIRWGVLNVEGLQERRKGIILTAFVVGAVLTPPDPATQLMMAVTLIVLYDLGGLLAAPSAATLKSFCKFTGVVALVAAAYACWFAFWPVGQVDAVTGSVQVSGGDLAAGQVARITRGDTCLTAAGASARLAIGGDGGATALLAGGATVQVNGPARLTLYGGDVLIDNSAGGRLEVCTGPATAILSGARSELRLPDPDTLVVTVLKGEALVRTGEVERRIAAGQTVTVRRGGAPADLAPLDRRWRDMMQGSSGKRPAPAQ